MKKPKTLKDLRNDPRVDSIHSEYDGCYGSDVKAWWCYLKPGWEAYSNQQHTIHERTIKDVCNQVHWACEWPEDPELNN